MVVAYVGVGAGMAAARVLSEKLGLSKYDRQDSTWIIATAITDIMCWPLVLAVLLLKSAAHSTQS